MTGFNKKSNYQKLIREEQEHATLLGAWDGQALLCAALQIYLHREVRLWR